MRIALLREHVNDAWLRAQSSSFPHLRSGPSQPSYAKEFAEKKT
jgi:hypothetical protein